VKNSVTLVIPETLARWIAAHMPDAPELNRVRVSVGPRIPVDWIPGSAGRYIGLTLWNRIWLRAPFEFKGRDAYELLFHELTHVRQFAKNPIRFPIRYLLDLIFRGYRNNRFEIEAREVAAALLKEYAAAHAI